MPEPVTVPSSTEQRISVSPLAATDSAEWDRFVDACPEATFFHRAGWREVIERAFGHRTHFLLARRGTAIEGVLPLAEIRSRLFGHSLVSLPFCVYGGIAAVNPDAREALDAEAQRLASSLGVGHLEYRNRVPFHSDWHTNDLYVTFRGEIDADPEANLKRIPRKQRAMVRKGIKAGLEGVIDSDTSRFFGAYARSVLRLGTPVFSKRYFQLLKSVFGADCEILTIEHEGQVISSVLTFYFRDEVLPYYGGGTDEARRFAANDFMYWDLLRRSAERGYRVFDFGRSKVDTGSYHFKRHWGFEPIPLSYEYQLHRAQSVPEHNPLNPRYQRLIRIWQRLPLGVANLIGPHIVKNLG